MIAPIQPNRPSSPGENAHDLTSISKSFGKEIDGFTADFSHLTSANLDPQLAHMAKRIIAATEKAKEILSSVGRG
ncbi:MAG: hypothetical protein JSS10_03435 [Verrucomicrobia bacterium]|nr:hypothetical protein [Verrucomicrobiota bacterium]